MVDLMQFPKIFLKGSPGVGERTWDLYFFSFIFHHSSAELQCIPAIPKILVSVIYNFIVFYYIYIIIYFINFIINLI
jgi:hypothetical protein